MVMYPLRTNQLNQPVTGSCLPFSLPRAGTLGGLAVSAFVSTFTLLPLCAATTCQYSARALPALKLAFTPVTTCTVCVAIMYTLVVSYVGQLPTLLTIRLFTGITRDGRNYRYTDMA